MAEVVSGLAIHPVEARLSALQNSHRLGLHIWEEHSAGSFPQYSHGGLSKFSAKNIPLALNDPGAMPLLSMSLLPSETCKRAMRPFGVNQDDDRPQIGYLVDFDQNRPHPARVIRVAPENLASGNDLYSKDLKLDETTLSPAIDRLYHHFRRESDFFDAATSSDSRRHIENQLDTLGQYCDTDAAFHHSYYGNHYPNVIKHNEMLVAASQEHIAALFVPCYDASSGMKMEKVLGALAGLQHLEKGMDLPLVAYHIGQPNQGRFTFLAQGKKNYLSVILDTVKQWEKSGDTIRYFLPNRYKQAWEEIERLTGIDITRPLNEQHAAVELVKREIAACEVPLETLLSERVVAESGAASLAARAHPLVSTASYGQGR